MLTDGRTGKVAFDEHGDRTHAEYSVVNVQEQRQDHLAFRTLHTIGELKYDAVRVERDIRRKKEDIKGCSVCVCVCVCV